MADIPLRNEFFEAKLTNAIAFEKKINPNLENEPHEDLKVLIKFINKFDDLQWELWLKDVRNRLMANRPLTGKQKKFIDAYLGKANFNATQAARLAGYKGNGQTLGQTAHKLVNNGKIADEISLRLSESAMTSDEVLSRLGEQAKSDYKPYLNYDGTVDLKRLLDDDKGHLIKGFTPLKNGTRVDFYDGQSALNTLAKHHGLLTDKIDLKIESELESLLELLESNLDTDTYERVIKVLAQVGES